MTLAPDFGAAPGRPAHRPSSGDQQGSPRFVPKIGAHIQNCDIGGPVGRAVLSERIAVTRTCRINARHGELEASAPRAEIKVDILAARVSDIFKMSSYDGIS